MGVFTLIKVRLALSGSHNYAGGQLVKIGGALGFA